MNIYVHIRVNSASAASCIAAGNGLAGGFIRAGILSLNVKCTLSTFLRPTHSFFTKQSMYSLKTASTMSGRASMRPLDTFSGIKLKNFRHSSSYDCDKNCNISSLHNPISGISSSSSANSGMVFQGYSAPSGGTKPS